MAALTDIEKQVLIRALDILAEHFKAVQIFVQNHDPESDRTTGQPIGRGNHYARRAQIEDWLIEHTGAEEPEEDGP